MSPVFGLYEIFQPKFIKYPMAGDYWRMDNDELVSVALSVEAGALVLRGARVYSNPPAPGGPGPNARELFSVPLDEVSTIEMMTADRFEGRPWSARVTIPQKSFFDRHPLADDVPHLWQHFWTYNNAREWMVFANMRDGDRKVILNTLDHAAAIKMQRGAVGLLDAARAGATSAAASAPAGEPSPATPEKGFSL